MTHAALEQAADILQLTSQQTKQKNIFFTPMVSSHGLEEYLDLFLIYLELLRAIWSHFKPFQAIWCYLEPFQPFWDLFISSHIKQIGAIWSHLGQFAVNPSHLELFSAIESYLEPYGAISSHSIHFWQFGAFWSDWDMFRAF